jgi:hypothetical protein
MSTHDITCQRVNTSWYCSEKDESNSINAESAAVWKDKIPPHLMSKQTPKGIFSADLRVVHFTTFFLKKTYTLKQKCYQSMDVHKKELTEIVCVKHG